MLKMVGASGQLSLGKQYAGRSFEVEVLPDGAILLKPSGVAEDADAWLHTPDLKERLRQADVWMDQHPPAETDLDALASRVTAGRGS